jgi:peptide/nickel transport system permease protein
MSYLVSPNKKADIEGIDSKSVIEIKMHQALSPRRVFLRRFFRDPLAIIGVSIIIILSLSAIFADQLAPYEPTAIDLRNMLSPPSRDHLLGTDDLGRDLISRLLFAGRISLLVGYGTAILAVSLGMIAGAMAGFFGGYIDTGISRIIDTLLSLMSGFLEITPLRLMIIIASLSWMSTARLVRAETLSLREREFVAASRALGASSTRIVFAHILPNTLSPIIVSATILVAHAILIESALSFLGFGIQPPDPTWGNMLKEAQRHIRDAPWLAIYPGLLISFAVASINFIGDGIRDALDASAKR